MDIFSTNPTLPISINDYNTARQLLAGGDRTGMYLFLAQKTGNPAYVNTAQISSGSGCLVGGPAIAINAYLQSNYSTTYPKYSIEEFSKVVAQFELNAFELKTNSITGEQYYQSPSELGSYLVGRNAWGNANPGHPELIDLFPGNVLLYGHYATEGNFSEANKYVNEANNFLIPQLGKVSFQEIANVGTQYGITLTQSLSLVANGGGSMKMEDVPGLNGKAMVFYDGSGKTYSVYTPKDVAICGLEPFSPGQGVPETPINKISFDFSESSELQPAVLKQKVGELFPELTNDTPTSQQALAGLATALALYGGNAEGFKNESGELIITGGGRQTIVDLTNGNWSSSIVKSNNALYFQNYDGSSLTTQIRPEEIKGDKDGNVVQIKINVDGSGTANVYDEFGNLINQATIQKPDGIDSTTGTVTVDTEGNHVTFDVKFDFDEETGEFINIAGIQSINGQTPISDNLIDNAIADLNLNVGDFLLGQNTGTLNQLIATGDPTDTDGFIDISTDGGVLTDVQNLVVALKGGSSLPIATSLFNFSAHLSGGGDGTLGSISQDLNTVTSILGFRDSLKRGDAIAALYSGASLAKGGLELYKSVLNSQIQAIELSGGIIDAELAAESSLVNEAVTNLADVLPYLGLINGLAHGDVASVIGSIAGIAGIPYVGWIIAAYEILSALFDDGPDIYADAVFVSNGDGINVHSVLTSDNDNGGASASDVMQNLLKALESTLKDTQGMGLIAQRLPHIHFQGYESGGGVLTMYYSDAVTGKTYERNFDAKGKFISFSGNADTIDPADAGFNGEIANSPDFYKGIFQQFVEAAYRMGAIAPQWMVKTVDAQSSRGQDVPVYTTYYDENGSPYDVQTGIEHIGAPHDPYAGYTTLQRAAALGQLLLTDAGDALQAGPNAQQTAQPIVLDLDGNGISVTTRAQGGSVLVDVDGDGFAEETDWINPRDGILAIDRNGDGKISGGNEIFNDSQVDMGKRGLHALDELDANGDGKITEADFGFTHLNVWQDINHNGQVEDFELSTLMQRGITEIDINSGKFVMDGQVKNIQNVALQADSAGFITQPLGNSLLLIKETGESSLLASALADYGQVDDSAVRQAHTHTSADGLLSVVDELMDGLEDVPITVSVAQLLDNDSSVTGTTQSIIGVGNAFGGTVNLDQVAGTIKFTPSLNFNGKASFDYIVKDSEDRQATATAFVDVDAVNDDPVITNTIFSRSAKWEDIGQTVTSQEGSSIVTYSLPSGAALGAAFSDGSGITPFADSFYADQYGSIGFEDGLMYWGSYNVNAGATSWQPVNIVDPNRGTISATDVESPVADITYKLHDNVQFGQLSFDEITGAWSYVHTANDGFDDAFVVEVTDKDKGSSQIKVVIANPEPYYGYETGGGGEGENSSSENSSSENSSSESSSSESSSSESGSSESGSSESGSSESGSSESGSSESGGSEGGGSEGGGSEGGGGEGGGGEGGGGEGGGGEGAPVILDLNRNGFHLIAARDSRAFYDFTGDGVRERTGWTSGADGLLAYDVNGDNAINLRDEIRFKSYKPGARTDLEGLSAFDTNQDGKLSAADAQWSKFYVWQDADENGMQTAGELLSLAQRGIQSINLTSDNVQRSVEGNTIYGEGFYTRTDGSVAKLADVRFSLSTEQEEIDPKDDVTADAGGGNISTGSGDDRIHGSDGIDTIYAGSGSDRVAGAGDNDVIYGDSGNDLVSGDAGDDSIFGGMDNDTLLGGTGNDLLHGNDGNDRLSGDAGSDRLQGDNGNDVLFGGDGDDTLHGNNGNDNLYGGAGNDWLDGGAGSDTMQGDTGNDIYIVGRNLDRVIELPSGGIDTVISYVDIFGIANVENTVLAGTEDLEAIGNADANILFGNQGDNYIDGGAGADVMVGGAGNDIYIVDNVTDKVIELADAQPSPGASVSLFGTDNLLALTPFNTYGHVNFTGSTWGIDTIKASVSYVLPENVENLTLTGITAINATGNSLNNLLMGNVADNRLNGGIGNDTLVGGAGNDTLVGEEGNDLLDGKDGNDILIGLSGADTLTGNGGQDRFIFHLGDGNDTITGFGGVGKGSNPSAAVISQLDTLQFIGNGLTARNLQLTQNGNNLELTFLGAASTKVTLKNLQLENLDNLPANGSRPAIGNILFDGQTTITDTFDVIDANSTQTSIFNKNTVTFLNDLNNNIIGFDNSNDVINGQGGNDKIDGLSGNDLLRGGAGNDTLIGGADNDILVGDAGADRFLYNTDAVFVSSAVGIDTISDFKSSQGDKIVLDKTTFSAIASTAGNGFSHKSDFQVTKKAGTSTAKIVYDPLSGQLFYNQNGSAAGFGSGGLFATLTGAPTLTASDFVLQA